MTHRRRDHVRSWRQPALRAARWLAVGLGAYCLTAGGAAAEEPGAAGRDPARIEAARRYFGDIELVDQDGREVRLYSDLLEGRAVVISTFFTSCPAACPVLMRKLRGIRAELAEQTAADVTFLSISVDPETDTQPALQAYARQLEIDGGWRLLSGDPERVRLALRKLGQLVDTPDAHTNILLIGNERTGLWKKAFGMSDASELVGVIRSVIEDGASAGAAGGAASE